VELVEVVQHEEVVDVGEGFSRWRGFVEEEERSFDAWVLEVVLVRIRKVDGVGAWGGEYQ
jgi:hypothetical protein